MQPNPTAIGTLTYLSQHRFGLAVLACTLMLATMLAVVGSVVGFTPVWATHVAPASVCNAPRATHLA